MLVVDEASMLDLPLSAALLAALPPHCSLLIVGDADQLPPVGPGAVLRDALRSGALPAARLQAVFRQAAGSLIVRAAHAVNRGEFPPLAPVSLATHLQLDAEASALAPLPWDAFSEGFRPRDATPVAASVAVAPPARLDALWVRLPESGSGEGGAADAVLAALQALVRHTLPAAGLDPRTQLQVITPMRRGPHGAGALCAALAPLLNPRSDFSSAPELSRGSTVYRIGDRVLQAVNDYTKEVFNGDLGTVRAVDVGARRVSVDFGRADGGAVDYTGAELEALLPAWAVTVHKAQGSEFPAVVLLLNAGALHGARARARDDAAPRRARQSGADACALRVCATRRRSAPPAAVAQTAVHGAEPRQPAAHRHLRSWPPRCANAQMSARLCAVAICALTLRASCDAATAVRTKGDEERYSHLAERLAASAGVELATDAPAALPQLPAQAQVAVSAPAPAGRVLRSRRSVREADASVSESESEDADGAAAAAAPPQRAPARVAPGVYTPPRRLPLTAARAARAT